MVSQENVSGVHRVGAQAGSTSALEDTARVPVVRRLPAFRKQTLPTIGGENSGTGFVESFTLLAMMVERMASEHPPLRTLLVMGAQRGEGRSTTAANLAIALAHRGRSVLLVESD